MSAVVSLPVEFETKNTKTYGNQKESNSEITAVAAKLQADTKLMKLWLRGPGNWQK